MKIVGHRGAAGIALENTMQAFEMAKQLGVDAIELDIQLTKDLQFVVCHDKNLRRVSTSKATISQLTYDELGQIPLHNGQTVPLLTDVLQFINDVPVVLDIKFQADLSALMEIIEAHSRIAFTIVGRPNKVIKACKQLRPDIPAFVAKIYTPFGILRAIKNNNADGVNLKAIWLNPYIYQASQRHNYQIQIYNVDTLWIAKLIRKFYPKVWICTNRPDRLVAGLRPSRAVDPQTSRTM